MGVGVGVTVALGAGIFWMRVVGVGVSIPNTVIEVSDGGTAGLVGEFEGIMAGSEVGVNGSTTTGGTPGVMTKPGAEGDG